MESIEYKTRLRLNLAGGASRGAGGAYKSWIGPSCGSMWRSIVAPDTTASNLPVKLLSEALETTCQYEPASIGTEPGTVEGCSNFSADHHETSSPWIVANKDVLKSQEDSFSMSQGKRVTKLQKN